MEKLNKLSVTLLITIIGIGFIVRIYHLNWDERCCMHPDERAIIMAAVPLAFPKNIEEFFTPESPLNPHFFAYGSFPMYLLKSTAYILRPLSPGIDTYEKMYLLGRGISALADTITIVIIFLIARRIRNNGFGLLASLVYALSVLPIQTSHFFVVDILLTCFIFLTLYMLLRFYEKPTVGKAILIGFFFGLSLTTKVSSLPLLFAIFMTYCLDFIVLFLRSPHKPSEWSSSFIRALKHFFMYGIIMLLVTAGIFVIFEPYALIDKNEFIKQNLVQAMMTRNPFVFPYTLQYVGITPYLYPLKNIFLWGLGPIIASSAYIGFVLYLYIIYKKKQSNKQISSELIVLSFAVVYFGIVGSFAVGWMRYMLPLYPFLALCSGLFLYSLVTIFYTHFQTMRIALVIGIVIGSILFLYWPLSFLSIYNERNTRYLASDWINTNIAEDSTIAIEHWDDSLPTYGIERYTMLSLPLYEHDTTYKWDDLNQKLSQTDYIIIASNRLYVPLQKLGNCDNIPEQYCYKTTALYYKMLFSEKLGFRKVAEFAKYPSLPFLNIRIDDQTADESFTVYDHPKIMIFKKDSGVIPHQVLYK